MKTQNQKSSRFAGLTESELAKLIQQYGCGPVRFSGTDEALYERHLVFDNVMEMAAIGARERFEAIAHSVRDVLSQRWIHTEKTYERQNAKRVYYLSMISTRRTSRSPQAQDSPSRIAARAHVFAWRARRAKSSLSRRRDERREHGEERDSVDREADADTRSGDDDAGDRGADHAGTVEEARVQRDRVRQLVARRPSGTSATAGRARRRRAPCRRAARVGRRQAGSPSPRRPAR